MNRIDYGKPPIGGWAAAVSELYVKDLATSLKFWCSILGFQIAYQKPEEGFAYLERLDGAQVMLYQPIKENKTETKPAVEPSSKLSALRR